jgi:hypothetical protein
MESRRRPRAPYRGWVEICSGGERARAEGHDLGVDGIGLVLPEAPLPVNGPLVSEFALPGISLPLELRGRWVWLDEKARRGGIRFEEMDAGLADLLSNFVAGRL